MTNASTSRLARSAEPARGAGSEFLEEFYSNPSRPAISTGFPTIDFATAGGLHQNELVVVGGSSGSGKTALLERWALNIALQDIPVSIVTLEMPVHRIKARLIAKLFGRSVFALQRDLNHEVEEYAEPAYAAVRKLDTLPIHVTGPESGERWTARECFLAAWRNRSQVVFIDYARELKHWQDEKLEGRRPPDVIAKQIETMTQRCGMAVVLGQQLKLPPTWGNRRPTREMLYDGQALAHKADTIVLVHRALRGESPEGVAELLYEKNRNGREGKQHVGFGEMDFHHLSHDEAMLAPCCAEERAAKLARARKAAV